MNVEKLSGHPKKLDRPPIRQRIPLAKRYVPAEPPPAPTLPKPQSVDRAVSPVIFTTTKTKVNLEIPTIQQEPLIMIDKEVTATEVAQKTETRSIGVYFNAENPKAEQIEASDNPTPSIYLLPFNPNSIYGLKGDSYFHGSVFQAQPKIPETGESLIFKSPYKLSPN